MFRTIIMAFYLAMEAIRCVVNVQFHTFIRLYKTIHTRMTDEARLYILEVPLNLIITIGHDAEKTNVNGKCTIQYIFCHTLTVINEFEGIRLIFLYFFPLFIFFPLTVSSNYSFLLSIFNNVEE